MSQRTTIRLERLVSAHVAKVERIYKHLENVRLGAKRSDTWFRTQWLKELHEYQTGGPENEGHEHRSAVRNGA